MKHHATPQSVSIVSQRNALRQKAAARTSRLRIDSYGSQPRKSSPATDLVPDISELRFNPCWGQLTRFGKLAIRHGAHLVGALLQILENLS